MTLIMSLNDYVQACHQTAVDKGFWENGADRNFGEMIALVHSELSEALEEHRAGRHAVYFEDAKPEGIAVELADAVIRLFDLFHILDVDMDEIVQLKMAYNNTRPPKHGKLY